MVKYYLSIGFLGLISSMLFFMASYAEKKFYETVSRIYEVWDQERRRLAIGTEEYRRRMEAMERLMPKTAELRRLLNVASVTIVVGLLCYCYSILALFKGWQPQERLLKLFVVSAFFFIFSGFSSYYTGKKINTSIQKISKFLKEISVEAERDKGR